MHFRPKGGVEEPDGTRLHYYYAWLAYDWENLLLSCRWCDVKKRSFFPVEGARARLLASVDECRRTENGLLLDPSYDDPELQLAFDASGLCRPLTERGQTTIQLVDLNREALVRERQQTWRTAQFLARSLDLRAGVPANRDTDSTLSALSEMLSGSQPYTAVARAAYSTFIQHTRAPLEGVRLPDPRVLWPGARLERPPADKESITLKPEIREALEAATRPRRQYAGRAALPPRAHETIRRIEVRNFKAIESLEFDLAEPAAGEDQYAPALVLLGENASGKTSVLDAVGLALLGTEQIGMMGLSGSDYLRRTGGSGFVGSTDESAEVVVHFDGKGAPVRLTIDARSGRFEESPIPPQCCWPTVRVAFSPIDVACNIRPSRTSASLRCSTRLRSSAIRRAGCSTRSSRISIPRFVHSASCSLSRRMRSLHVRRAANDAVPRSCWSGTPKSSR